MKAWFACGIALVWLIHAIGSALAQTPVTPAANNRSLLVLDASTLDALNGEFDFTGQLTALDAWSIERNRARLTPGRLAWTPGQYVELFFASAYRDQVANAKMPAGQRIGGPYLADRTMDAVFRTWMPEATMARITDRQQLRGGPFRLLAVVNRMDVASDFDDDGAIADPRALGEVHLVYGMVDRAYEAMTGQPFPMVFVIAYRLPPIMWQAGEAVLDSRYKQRDLATLPAIWSWKMSAWASLWGRLSNQPAGSPAHLAAIRTILRLAATPDNFIHVRSNTRVNETEWELREWYQLGTNQSLVTRKPRGEPYHCSSGTAELTGLVNRFWSSADADLDMRTRDALWTRFKGLNGWVIPRDDGSPLLAGATSYSNCGTGPTTSPYAMYAPANAVFNRPQVVFKAPFARANASFVWRLAPGVDERRRHAFAIRTCSGCHGREGATAGFHISPRLAGQNAALSAFMTGAPGNTFSIRDQKGVLQTYAYNELEVRRGWFTKFYNRTARMFDSLLRAERK